MEGQPELAAAAAAVEARPQRAAKKHDAVDETARQERMAERAWPVIEAALKMHSLHSQPGAQVQAQALSDCDLAGVYILSLHSALRKGAWCTGRLPSKVVDTPGPSVLLSSVDGLVELLGGPAYLDKKLLGHHQHQSSSSGKNISAPTEATAKLTVAGLFNELGLSSLKGNKGGATVNTSMVQWSLGNRPFRLMTTVPSPMSVLRQQARGQRVVTVFATKEELSCLQSGPLVYMDGAPNHTRDALEFTVHDLQHMENFWGDASTRREQQGFFACMLRIDPRDFFLNTCQLDEKFWQQLEYVLSDMNCCVPHLLQYTLAKLVAALEREAGGTGGNVGGEVVSARATNLWAALLDRMGMVCSGGGGGGGGGEARRAADKLLLVALKMGPEQPRGGALSPQEADELREWFEAQA